MARGLSEKQERFCLEYVATGNASEAYRRVYRVDQMKEETIRRKAKELLDNGKITARLEELRAPLLEKAMITEERVLKEVARIAFFDIRRIFSPEGRLLPIQDWSDDSAAAVAGVEVLVHGHSDDDGEPCHLHKIRLCSKDKQLELAGKYLKLFTDKTDHLHKFDFSGASDADLQEIIASEGEGTG